jgi:hypothetical protein
MDVLNSIILKAESYGLLQPLLRRGIGQRISLYADDVVLFMHPVRSDLETVKQVLMVFGEASGLVTNLAKSSFTPICCNDQEVLAIQETLSCNLVNFPCKYLGLPLSIRKLSRRDLLPLVEKVADRLPGWKAALIHPAGRATLVKSVLSAIPVYHLIALQCHKWVIKAIDKIRRGFLWKGRKNIKGGHCLVGWQKVCLPLTLGGLGVPNLEVMGWSLNMRWLWLKKTQPERLWAFLDVQVHPNAAALFAASVQSVAGSGTDTKFWTDRWLHGKRIADWAPSLFAAINKKAVRSRTFQEAINGSSWVLDIRGNFSSMVFSEFFQIWDLVREVRLLSDVPDQHIWTPSSSGSYSSKSAYDHFMMGKVGFAPAELIWRSWAPPRCKFFLWLATRDRCWTADRLAKRGLDHPVQCPLCDQEDETVHHLLISCVFSREVWFRIFSLVNLRQLSPTTADLVFQDWWANLEAKVPYALRKGINSLVMLVAWWLWKQRNNCVFEGDPPSGNQIIQNIKDDAQRWCLAGAKDLGTIWP